jgi:predicted NBD/HSP70 family sugar kinase
VSHPDRTRSDGTTVEALSAVCIEVGASGCETAHLQPDGTLRHESGVGAVDGRPLLMAVPGLIADNRVAAASNLAWFDVDPADELGLTGPARLVRNDAEAAALGEHVLRGAGPDLLFVGLGTGVGGAVVRDGQVVGNLLGHRGGFGSQECRCGFVGCLETVAGGWALPDPLTRDDLARVAAALAIAIQHESPADSELIVIGGGITGRYPQIVPLLATALPSRQVEPSAAPAAVKSASAWGLLHEFRRLAPLPQ